MKLIQLNENVRLNNHQKYIILQTKLASTPEVAYEQINKSESDIRTREILDKMGVIRVSETDKTAVITNTGEQLAINYGLVDNAGNLTEIGEELLEN